VEQLAATARQGAMMIDPQQYRKVLGHYPTGVCAITSEWEGRPVAMVVGTFTSVSLDPPLIGFLPDKKSTSWPKIRQSGRFCVNVLSAGQLEHCRKLASKDEDRFDAVLLHRAPDGHLKLDGALIQITCDLQAVVDAGDHEFAMGAVRSLDVGEAEGPLLFFKGGYGVFGDHSSWAGQHQGP
jgi:3-hydroxy-9,10-secoandrosta-1,3,5(10)-triene-9,17-dione monooxygenase reductase component